MPTFTSVATSDFASGLGTDWAQLNNALAGDILSSAGVFTGQFGEQPTGQHAMARWVGSGTFTDAQYSEVVCVQWLAYGSTHTMGPTVQMTSGTGASKTGYELYCKSVSGGELYIIKWSAGTRTVLVGPITQSLSNGDALMLADSGGVLTGYVNRTAVSGLTYTDSSPLTGGKPGIAASGVSMQGTSVEMGTVSAPASLAFSGPASAQTGTVSSAFSWTGSALSSFFSGGTTPYAYTILSGTLPAGLTINSTTGVISGTPTTAGTATIVVRATDSAGSPATADSNSFNIVISAAAATATTLTGPSGGLVGAPSTSFTVGANGTITGTVTITPSDGLGGGTFTPTSVSISSTTPTNTFVYTPVSSGAKTIAISDDGGLTDATSLTYTASTTSGTLTSSVLKNNTGTVLASTAFSAYVHTPSTGALVVLKTGITTNSSGVASFSDGTVVASTSYRVIWKATTGGAEGMETLTAT